MNIKELLIYKTDEKTGIQRVSKTKIIPLTIFIIFFLGSFVYYIITPKVSPNIIISLIAAIIVGIVPAAPIFIIGWIIDKFLNRKNTRNETIHPLQQNNQYKQQNIQNTNDLKNSNPCPHDNAARFKNAITENNSDLAAEILSKWNENDANYLYAKIIFEGMPPSDVTSNELNTWLKNADNMTSCDEKLRSWFKDNAIKVMKIHE